MLVKFVNIWKLFPKFATLGVPYAKPPVGKLRFCRSEPFGTWEGTLNGTWESKKSLQPNVLSPKSPFREGGEDCLYLNVYTKKLKKGVEEEEELITAELLPVVVFFHGGAFVVGSCESMLYGPQILLDRDLVMVGVNYRLGPLGFLSLETDKAPGNLGLHDQYLALVWVKENIEVFGGDPNKVTLMGESAGAMSAMCHLVSPTSKGLFHKVIALSGTCSSSLLLNDRTPRTYACAVAQKLGYKGDLSSPDLVLEFLQQQPAVDILKQSTLFLDWDYVNPMPWVPIQDSFSSNPFLPRSFHEAVKAGEFMKVPVVMGLCKDEGLILSAPFYRNRKRWNSLVRNWEQWAPLIFLFRERELQTQQDADIAKEIGRFYFGPDTDVSSLEADDANLKKLTEMYSMSCFYSGFDEDSKLLARSSSEVYSFILTHPPDFSLMDIFRLSLPNLSLMFTCRSLGFNPFKKEFGVCHGDDLNYLFPMNPPGFPKTVVTPGQVAVQQHLVDLVASFATTSKPQFNDENHQDIWKPVNPDLGEYLNLGVELRMERDPELARQMKFWQKIMNSQKHRILSERPINNFFDKIAVERE